MVTRVFFDTNIIQDIIQGRPGFQTALALVKDPRHKLEIYISVLSIATIWYINEQNPNVWLLFQKLRTHFTITDLPADRALAALDNPLLSDLEDEFQRLTAQVVKGPYILTRDKEFPAHEPSALTPEQFLHEISQSN